MNRNWTLAAIIAATFAIPSASHAHFLWAEIRSTPQRHVAIELADFPGVSAIAAVNGKAGKVKPVPASLKYGLDKESLQGNLSNGDRVAGAALEYGVLDRKDQGRGVFKLNYFAKAVEAPRDGGTKLNLHIELVAKLSGEDLVVSVLRDGKPSPEAETTYSVGGGAEVKGKADVKGQFTVPSGGKTPVAVMVMVSEEGKGTLDGQSYDMVRNYSTLTVGRYSTPVKGDSEAFNALKSAVENREKFPTNLLGFRMEVEGEFDGKTVKGSFNFDTGNGVTTNLTGDDAAKKWVEGQIRSIVLHRSGGRFEDGDGSHEITFTGSTNSLGREVAVADDMKSSYRLKDGQIFEVVRTMGPTKIVVALLDSIDTSPGKKLATQMSVAAYDAVKGTLLSSEVISDSFAPLDGVWLPTRRRVARTDASGVHVNSVNFRSMKLVLK